MGVLHTVHSVRPTRRGDGVHGVRPLRGTHTVHTLPLSPRRGVVGSRAAHSDGRLS